MPQKIHLFQLRIQDKRNPLEGPRMLYLALCHYLDLLLLDHTRCTWLYAIIWISYCWIILPTTCVAYILFHNDFVF